MFAMRGMHRLLLQCGHRHFEVFESCLLTERFLHFLTNRVETLPWIYQRIKWSVLQPLQAHAFVCYCNMMDLLKTSTSPFPFPVPVPRFPFPVPRSPLPVPRAYVLPVFICIPRQYFSSPLPVPRFPFPVFRSPFPVHTYSPYSYVFPVNLITTVQTVCGLWSLALA